LTAGRRPGTVTQGWAGDAAVIDAVAPFGVGAGRAARRRNGARVALAVAAKSVAASRYRGLTAGGSGAREEAAAEAGRRGAAGAARNAAAADARCSAGSTRCFAARSRRSAGAALRGTGGARGAAPAAFQLSAAAAHKQGDDVAPRESVVPLHSVDSVSNGHAAAILADSRVGGSDEPDPDVALRRRGATVGDCADRVATAEVRSSARDSRGLSDVY